MADRLSESLARRQSLLVERDAVRLSHHDWLAGVTVDDYAGHLLFTDYRGHEDRELADLARRVLAALRERDLPARGAVVKRRPDDLAHRGTFADRAPTPLAGDPIPETFTIIERGMRFEISFTEGGFATGLFLDMAGGRRAVRDWCARREQPAQVRVLNLFSYTGGFSIAAAIGGAGSILEVDASRKWLGWSQRNQQHNGLWGTGVIRQRCEDAVKYLARQPDRGYDLILCDPPSYAHPKRGRRFRVEDGYRAMADHLQRVLAPGGAVLACCNHAQTPEKRFREWLPRALHVVKRIEPEADFDGADYLKALWLARPTG